LNEQARKLSRPAVPALTAFPGRVPDIIRFADLDRQGHVNNAVYSTYLETGRVAIIYDPDHGFQVEGATTVLARLEIDFRRELHWPGTVEIGTAVAEIGRSSYTLQQAVFHDGECAAIGRATMVLMDRATRQSQELPSELIERLKRYQITAG
jgi:acyl-CoA thioester hydrolase